MNKQIFTKTFAKCKSSLKDFGARPRVFIAMVFFIIASLSGITGYAQTINTYVGNGNGSGPSGDGGAATAATISNPAASAVDTAGNLYIFENPYLPVVRKITPSGIISTIAGGGSGGVTYSGPATGASLSFYSEGIALDAAGNLYIVDEGNNVIRKVTTDGNISTIAGNGTAGFSGDGSAATLAELNLPIAVTADAAGNIYIADYSNGRIRKVNSSGIISTIAGAGGYGSYTGIAGVATTSAIGGVYGLTFDATGNLYLADGDDGRILKIDAAGILSSVAGNASYSYSGDGGPATAAGLNYPASIAFDAAGNMYIVDTYNNVVRKIDAVSDTISTVIGLYSGGGYSGDGGPATAAEMSTPFSISLDAAGNAYVTDYYNNRVRVVTPDCSSVTAGSIHNATGNSFCTSGTDTLTLTGESNGIGITYQWLSSTDGVTWTNPGNNYYNGVAWINPGSNTISYYTGTLTATTYYKAIATCGGSAGIHDTTQVDTITINPVVAPTLSISAGPGDTVCTGTSVTFTAITTNSGATPSYQWTKNGNVVGSNSATYTDNSMVTADAIICTMTSSAVCAVPAAVTGNAITMTVNPILTPTVSISSSSGSTICAGTNVTFTAAITNGGTNPSYAWTKNGVAVGSNSSYIDAALNDGDAIVCTLTSNAACVANTAIVSNTITMAVSTGITPTVSIGSAPVSPVCSGSSVIFTATPDGGGSNPSYQWTKNGNVESSTTATYTDNNLNNGDAIICTLTSDATCATTSTATSNMLTMSVNADVAPTVNIAASATTICAGTSVTFTATSTNEGASPSYHWTKNGNTVTGTGNTYTDNSLNTNDAIACTLTSDAICAMPATAASNTITMTVNPVLTPAINITSSTIVAVCAGTPITFTATQTNGGTTPVYQWTDNGTTITGATDATYSSATFNNNDVIACTITSDAICAMPATVTSNTITTTITPVVVPTLSISTTPGDTICAGSTVTCIATQTNGGTALNFQWSVNGTNVFSAGSYYVSNSLNNTDTIACTITSNLACAFPATVRDSVIITTVITPAISISASLGDTVCAGALETFTAAVTDGGTTPAYQWTDNGTAIAGATNLTYSSSSLSDNDAIACKLTSDGPCGNDLVTTSNIIVIVIPVDPPVVSITANPGTNATSGQPVTFTATVTNGGTTPVYQWQNDGTNIPGATTNPYTTSSLTNNNVITCLVHSNAACVNPDSAISNQLLMQITPSTGVTSVMGSNDNIQLYPNPNSGAFNIKGTIQAQEAQIEVLNVIGQVVYKEIVPVANGAINKQVLLSNGSANGIYLLRITTDNGSSVTRFVVER